MSGLTNSSESIDDAIATAKLKLQVRLLDRIRTLSSMARSKREQVKSQSTSSVPAKMTPETSHKKNSISTADLSHQMLKLNLKASPTGHAAKVAADDLHDITSCTSATPKKNDKATKDTMEDHNFSLRFPHEITSPDRTDKSHSYLKRHALNLFGTAGVPTVLQVQQGKLNNCYLCCAMLLLAEYFPRELKECITELDTCGNPKICIQPNGHTKKYTKKGSPRRFRVALYGKGACNTRTGGTVEPRSNVIVNDEFYTKRDNKTIIYARSPKTDPALWPMVLEKAIAAFQWRKSHLATKGTTAVAKGDVYAYIDAKLPDSNFNKCCQVVQMVCRYPARMETCKDFKSDWDTICGRGKDHVSSGGGRGASIWRTLPACIGTKQQKHLEKEMAALRLFSNHNYLCYRAGHLQDGSPFLWLLNPHNRRDKKKRRDKRQTDAPFEKAEGDQLYQVPPVLGKGNTSRHFLVLEQHWHLFEKYELINCNRRSPIKNRAKSTSKRSDKRSAIKNRVKSTPKKNQVLDGC